MKKTICLLAALALCLAGCGAPVQEEISVTEATAAPEEVVCDGTEIVLSDSGITVDGQAVSQDTAQPVYTANDIVYYEEGHDFTYGEGTARDAHSVEEAAAHTVVHITQPGTYILSGSLSKGQVAVDLGDGAEEDPNAVVTLVLDGVDITCSVAPGIIFYNVYECGSTENPTSTVDTSTAGANVVLAEGSQNTVTGSYVARIYKPDSVVLSEDGSEVEDAKKLHKYDAAFYSKMSMNVAGSGALDIIAENEGLDSELHLTVNGGNIRIQSGNDGINTNEDGVSVTTINGGSVDILVTGETGEGDGIDSNGWLVINGGTVTAQACAFSGDAGIDSDMGIHINGGTVIATGNMLDRISESQQNYAVFQFGKGQPAGQYALKNAQGDVVAQQDVTNSFSYLIVSGEDLAAGEYTLWQGDTQLKGTPTGGMGSKMPFGGQMPEGMEIPEGMEPPEGMERPEGMVPPEGMEIPEGTMPEGMEMPQRPEGGRGQFGGFGSELAEASEVFTIAEGGNYFLVTE